MYTLVGKEHISGISKTSNKPYSFNKLYFVVDADDFNKARLEGQTTYDCICSDELFALADVGMSYEKLFYDSRKLLVEIR